MLQVFIIEIIALQLIVIIYIIMDPLVNHILLIGKIYMIIIKHMLYTLFASTYNKELLFRAKVSLFNGSYQVIREVQNTYVLTCICIFC